MAAFSPKTVHVLLVDSDMNTLAQTHRLLHYSSLKVSVVQEVASSFTLSKNGVGVDIVMVNPNCFNPLGFISFVRDAVRMGAIVILMCTKANTSQVKCAIEDGAYLVMEKPITFHDIKYLWQYVLHEKAIKRIIAKKSSFIGEAKSPSFSLSKGNITNRGMPMVSPSFSLSKGNITNRGMPMVSPSFSLSKGTIINRGMPMVQDSIAMNKVTCQKRAVQYLNFGPPSSNIYTSGGQPIKRKTFMAWKPDIHKKFIDAVKKLGDGKCFPKDIVELMNVPGLTRMQVASHLQKCRGPSAEYQRKVLMSSSKSQPSKKRRFGMCPLILEDPQDTPRQEEEEEENNNNMEQFYWPPNFGAPNNIVSMGSQEAAPKSVDMGSQNAALVPNTVNMASQDETPNFANMGSQKAAPGPDAVNMGSQETTINFVNMGSQEAAPVPNVVNMASQEAAPTVVNMEPQQEEFSAIFSMFNSMLNGNMIGHIADAPAPEFAPTPVPAPVLEPRIVSEHELEPVQPQGVQFDIPLDIPIAEEFDLQYFNLDPNANGVQTWPNGVGEEASGNSVWSFWDML